MRGPGRIENLQSDQARGGLLYCGAYSYLHSGDDSIYVCLAFVVSGSREKGKWEPGQRVILPNFLISRSQPRQKRFPRASILLFHNQDVCVPNLKHIEKIMIEAKSGIKGTADM